MAWLAAKKITGGLAAALITLSLIAAISNREAIGFQKAAGWREHSYQVLATTGMLATDLVNIQNSSRGYLLTGQDRFLASYRAALNLAASRLSQLHNLTQDNAGDQRLISQLEPLSEQAIAHFKEGIQIRRKEGLEGAAKFVSSGQGSELMARNLSVIRQIEASERSLLEDREIETESRAQRIRWMYSAGSLASVLLVVVALLSVNRDMKERRRAERQARQTAEEIQDLYNNAPCGYHSIDKDGTIVRINDTELRWLGYRREEVVGKMKSIDFYTPAGVELFHRTIRELLEHGSVKDLRMHMVRKDGTLLPVQLNATSVTDAAGNFVMSRTTFVDMTERERARLALEESRDYLETIIQAIADPVFVKDARHRWVLLNESFCQFMGRSREELIGGSSDQFLPPGQAAALRAREDEFLRSGRHSMDEDSYVDSHGVTRVIAVHSSLYENIHGEKFIVGVIRDVTDQKRVEHALVHARNEAERASRFKDQFLSTMSHELRTPLNAVLGFSELLGDSRYGSLNERQGRYVEFIRTAGQHLLRLISDILDLSKIEAGRMQLSIESVSVEEIVSDVTETLRSLAGRKSQSLTEAVEAGLSVRADRTRLKQVLLNLAGNSLKFTPEGGSIRIEAHEANGAVEFRVSDNGPGIVFEEQQKIFEAFQRGRQGDDEVEGTGLGLAICKRLIELQGGKIGLESAPGQGACFYFSLPPGAETRESVQAIRRGNEDSASRTILIVEDDPITAQLIQSQLVSTGYGAVICNHPESAAKMAAAIRPAAITLDLLMQPISGWDVLFQLKLNSQTSGIPVIVVSVLEQPARGAAFVADEYLLKPVKQADLLGAVERCCRKGAPAKPPILVVEDDAATRELVQEALHENGYAVVLAKDGQEARESVAAAPPQLVILDLALPKVSGFELLAEWRENAATAGLPVVVLTGRDLSQEEEVYLRNNTESLLRKSGQWKADLAENLHRMFGAA